MRALSLLLLAAPLAAADFERDIAPVLKRCTACHGATMQMSGLRLDSREGALAGGNAGAAIVAGKSADSLMIARVKGEKGGPMPPTGPRLTAGEVAALAAWIDDGAKWASPVATAIVVAKSDHWSFQPPRKVTPPAVNKADWVRNPIDGFILARLEQDGLAPSLEAERHTLIRRVSFDLTGLPPTPAEVAAFVNDTKPGAYERLVDRLIDSPHYGERWARHWLDLARYADSDGYEKDSPRPHAWRYRHWLINALNRDLPFDQFTTETMAGDLLPGANTETRVATGWHRNTLSNREGGTDPEQFRWEQMIDRASNTSITWLGLTTGCAQCHDHKFDPISQRSFYQLVAFFDQAEETNLDAPLPGERGPYLRALPEVQSRRAELIELYDVPKFQAAWEEKMKWTAANPGKSHEWDFAINVLRVLGDRAEWLLELGPARRSEKQSKWLTDHFIANYGAAVGKDEYDRLKFAELRDKLRELDKLLPRYSEAQVLMATDQDRRTHVRIRGDFRERGIEVKPAVLPALGDFKIDGTPTRVDLARWLVSTDNPLTARVTVNRFWNELFGRGLVRTTEDFGKQGEKPSHPELLDWLAVEFRERGWSQKQILRAMVTSATYRQSSAVRPDVNERDPLNILLARQGRLRLPAELVRDAALAVSGLINLEIGGRSIRPPQPKGVAEIGYANSIKWEDSVNEDRYRRGVYIHFQRTTPYPMLMNFDSPDSTMTCTRRQRSNTPLQALNLLNDPVFFEAAQGLAARVVRERPAPERVNYAFDLVLGRAPSPKEKDRMSSYLSAQREIFRKDPKAAALIFPAKLDGADSLDLSAWTAASRVLLNLDEFLTRE